jgi:NADPH:quinone reductase-like Zn-dependent oxidoreductase
VRIALDLGVAPARIDTVVNFGAVAELGVQAQGHAAGASAAVLADLAGLIATGRLEVPIAARFPLADVSEAYRMLERGGLLGKVVLIP